MAISLAVALRTLFCSLGCLMLATLIYTISVDGLPFRKSVLTPWMAATLVDFYINIVVLGAWVSYKESSWISAILWVVLLVCFGSITTCGYIVLQFLKLSSQESLQDPMFYVLLRHRSKDAVEGKKFSVVIARVLFSALGVLMLGTLIYTLLTDGSPFRSELFTPWMTATLIDFYINVVALSVWIAYKESSWMSALGWIALLICVGGIHIAMEPYCLAGLIWGNIITICAYIVLQLFQLSLLDPVYLVLLNSSTRSGFKMLTTSPVTP